MRVENTINLENFVYKNFHELNVRVYKFSWVSHENFST